MLIRKALAHYKTQSMTIFTDKEILKIPKDKVIEWHKDNGIPYPITLDQYIGREVRKP